MNCNDVQTEIEVYLDRELTLSDQRDFEEHLDGCENCQAMLEGTRLLNSSIQKVSYAKAPFQLRRKVKSDLKEMSNEDDANYNSFQLFGFGAGSAFLASITVWLVMTFMFTVPMQTQLINELTEAHVRSLMVDHVTDVTTSDTHTVKPWFSGKLDFSPEVTDLKNEGFQLIGGRLDYLQIGPLNNQSAAVLIYKRRSHYINLFIYREDGSNQDSHVNNTKNQSYNLINWRKQGLSYWAVSDLNFAELKQFSLLLDTEGAEKNYF